MTTAKRDLERGPCLRRALTAALGLIALAWSSSAVFAQTTSDPIGAAVEVLEPIAFLTPVEVNFGKVIKGSVNCTFKITPGGIESVTNGDCGIVEDGSAGSVQVNGTDNALATLTATVTNAAYDPNSSDVQLQSVILQGVGDGPTKVFKMDALVPIGATLLVTSGAVSGVYNACTFTISASYN